jgi:hypothetical protein
MRPALKTPTPLQVQKTYELDEKFLSRMDEWFEKERPEAGIIGHIPLFP